MKIWIVSDGEPLPIDGKDVRIRRMGTLAEILQSRGHSINWYSSTFHHYKKIQRSESSKSVTIKPNYVIELLKTDGYKKNVSFQRIKNYKQLKNEFLKIANLKPNPDVILATLAPLELSTAAIEYGEKHNIPVIIDIRDLWPDVFREVLPEKLEFLSNIYINRLKKKLNVYLNKAEGIVAVTPYFLQYGLDIAKRTSSQKDKVFYTSYKPFNSQKNALAFQSEWAEYGLNVEDFMIVFLGNFGKQFDLKPVFEAAASLNKKHNIKFIMCGTGENLEHFKEKYKDCKNIILPGWIDKEKISTLMDYAKLGIAPYRESVNFTKNAPNKFGEYLSASLPVLVGIDGLMKELLEENNCGLKYSSAEDLAVQIKSLYNDLDKLEIMSANALSLFNEKFNAELVYKEFAIHLEKISSGKSEFDV